VQVVVDTCRRAAEFGKLQALQWFRENECDWDESTCEAAAENGHLSVLQWARENECPWDHRTCEYAARNGHLSVLQWARKNGCDWNDSTGELSVNYLAPFLVQKKLRIVFSSWFQSVRELHFNLVSNFFGQIHLLHYFKETYY